MKLVHRMVSSQSKMMAVEYGFGFSEGVNQMRE